MTAKVAIRMDMHRCHGILRCRCSGCAGVAFGSALVVLPALASITLATVFEIDGKSAQHSASPCMFTLTKCGMYCYI